MRRRASAGPAAHAEGTGGTSARPSAWYRLDAVLPSVWRRRVVVFRFVDADGTDCGRIERVAPADGRFGEVLRLAGEDCRCEALSRAGDVLTGVDPVLRRVGFFERWREVMRALRRVFRRLSPRQRAAAGLSARRVGRHPLAAYRLAAELANPLFYDEWIARFEPAGDDRPGAPGAGGPRFRVLVLADEPAGDPARRSVESAVRAGGDRVVCTVVATRSGPPPGEPGAGSAAAIDLAGRDAWLAAFNAALAGRRDEWLLLLRAGDVLAPRALRRWVEGIGRQPECVAVYADDDVVDSAGRRGEPRFKPDWSPSFYLSTDYVGDAVSLRADAVAAVGGVTDGTLATGAFDLVLRLLDGAGSAAGGSIAHLPEVLLHRAPIDPEPAAEQAARRIGAVRDYLSRHGVRATVEAVAAVRDGRRIRHALPAPPPRVSVVVPTRDSPAMLRRCVDSVVGTTRYDGFEVLVVNNRSGDPAALSCLAELSARPGVRVLDYDRPFNFAAINNFAAQHAGGEVLCLLNDDTEVLTPDWLEEMVGRLLQPGVGVVGARLLYPDGTLQHAGDLLGLGDVAIHAHAHLSADEPGYMGRAMLAQEVSAVTAACMVVRADLYRRLGGLDAEALPVAFNDVDFCLRVQAAGLRVVFTPHAELIHHESASRRAAAPKARTAGNRRAADVMRRRWRAQLLRDPFYNPNLSGVWPDFQLSGLSARR